MSWRSAGSLLRGGRARLRVGFEEEGQETGVELIAGEEIESERNPWPPQEQCQGVGSGLVHRVEMAKPSHFRRDAPYGAQDRTCL